MSKTILVTGGSSSGKSRWAVSYLAACDYVLYLCAAEKIDPDILNRIEFGNKQNMVEWDIRENITENPAELFTDHKFVIFDNLPAYSSRIMKKMCPDISALDKPTEKSIEQKIISDVADMLDGIAAIDGTMIMITLETGFSLVSGNPEQYALRRILGVVNQRIANMSNEVYLSASGIQFKIK